MTGRIALGLLLLFPGLAGAQENARPAESPERLRADLEQGVRLFRRNPGGAAAKAYAASVGYVDVEYQGKTITVRDPWLADRVAALDAAAKPEDRAAAAREIADHLSARAASIDVEIASEAGATPRTASSAAPADPDKVLQGILDQRQFHAEAEDPKLAKAAATLRDQVRAAWDRLREFVRGIFSDEPRDEGWADKLRRLGAIIVAIACLLGGGWFLLRAILRATADDASTRPDAAMPEEPPRPAVMIAQADAMAARGDHLGAVRALYLALLGELHQQEAIVYDRHRTNREYLQAMRLDGSRAGSFSDAVELFDRKWYGKEPCLEPDLARFRALVTDAARREVMAA